MTAVLRRGVDKVKRLLLHLGMAKTGTTSLQETLGRNRKKLKSLGVIYPSVKPYNHSFKFQVLFKDSPQDSFHYKQLAPDSDEQWQKELDLLRRQWVDTFTSFDEGVCVISAENLPGMKEKEIERLLNFVQPHFDRISAIVYVREPRESLRSHWEQDVKESLGELSGEALLQRAKSRLSYGFLDRWSAVLGRDKMTVRPFDADKFHGGSLLADFFHYGDLGDYPELNIQERQSNQSLGPEGASFLQAFNRRYPQFVDGKLNPDRGLAGRMHLLYGSMRSIRSDRLNFEICFTAREASRINAQIATLNAYLAEEDRFEEVQATDQITDLPDPASLSSEYYLDLINQLCHKIDEFANVNESLGASRQTSGKPFEQVYLHLGFGKTGTTSIQSMLASRAQELVARGIHYPVSLANVPDFRGNHSRILRHMFDSTPEKSVSNILAGRSSRDAAGHWSRHLRGALEANLEAATAPRLLLSAEGVMNLRRADFIALIDWLSELGDEVKVIACVRHPLSALSSEMQQQLKTGALLESLYENPPYYRFRRKLGLLLKKLGRENLIVYDFAAATSHPLGVRGAFLEHLGTTIDLTGEAVEHANTSLSARAALILNAVNRRAPVIVDGKPNPHRPAGVLQALAPLGGAKFQAPRTVRERLRERTEPELQWLRDALGLQLQEPAEPRGREGENSLLEKLRAEISAIRLLRRLRSGS